jgi:hypothetical protein
VSGQGEVRAMSIYKRHDVFPEWEPIPWDVKGPQVDEQERGFHQRALKRLIWTKINWKDVTVHLPKTRAAAENGIC